MNAAAKFIRNLSDITLNAAEITALGKGLNFVPSFPTEVTSIMKDFSNTERLMRLRYILKDSALATCQVFRRKSTLIPLNTDSNKLEEYLYATRIELAKLTFKTRHKQVRMYGLS